MNKEKKISPPFFAELIMKYFFPDKGKFTTVGDLEESFYHEVNDNGTFKAKWWYCNEVYKSVNPIIKNTFYWGISMISNYFKLAWRNFLKYKTHSSINLIGLTFGIAASIIILLFTIDELNFDKFNTKYDRIGRLITEEFQENGDSRFYPLSAGIIGTTLVDEYPEVLNQTSLFDINVFGRFTMQYEDFKHHEADYLIAQPSFFEVFDYNLIIGDPQKLLHEPNEVVLTETTAKMFFGNENPIGKVIQTNRDWGNFKVTGLIEDPPGNSHLQFSMLISFNSIFTEGSRWRQIVNHWDMSTMKTYLLFSNESSMNAFGSKLKSFQDKHKTEVFGVTEALHLQPMKDIHFGSNNFEMDRNFGARSINTIYILGIIGFFIVLSACINYSNMSIAKYFNRAKEIGMRKVVGATKKQLFIQILSESLFMSILAVAAAIALVYLLLPSFNNYLEKNLAVTSDNSLLFITLLLTITVLVGLISGSLPAFFLTKLKTISLMKMKLKPGNTVSVVKKSLVVLQFVISIVMIFATITVYNQLSYIKNKDLGFDKEQMIIVDINSRDSRNNFQSIKNEFLKSSSVSKVTVSSRVPGDWKGIGEVPVNRVGGNKNEEQRMFSICADEDFLNVYDIKLKEGNFFTGNVLLDSSTVVVNEALIKNMNISDPIGKFIQINDRNIDYQMKIVGVVEDFNFHSLHQKVSPLVISSIKSPFEVIDYYSSKISMANVKETIAYLKTVHEKFDKGTVFEFNFLDEKIDEFYKQDIKEGTIINTASLISILIACLGLFGLASYTAQQKIKEIGIRKVLGATVSEITLIFSKEFLRLVIVAVLIAVPLGYYFMNQWLESFAYRINIGTMEILLSAFAAVFISVATISYQAIKSANTNPIETIRTE